MTIDNVINRRTALITGVAGAGTLALAACGSSSGGSHDPAKSQQPSAATQSTAAATSSAAAAPGSSVDSSSAGSSSAAGKPGGTQLAKLSDITVGEGVSAQLNGKPVIVSRPTETTAVCFSAICTHQGCTVAPAGKDLDCPCHGSQFDATTGAVLGGPAPAPLNKIAVTVSDGAVFASS